MLFNVPYSQTVLKLRRYCLRSTLSYGLLYDFGSLTQARDTHKTCHNCFNDTIKKLLESNFNVFMRQAFSDDKSAKKADCEHSFYDKDPMPGIEPQLCSEQKQMRGK